MHVEQHAAAWLATSRVVSGGSMTTGMAEWVESDGQRLLTRLVSDRSSAWQVKGFLHEGLYTEWPADLQHHNPGHPSGWAQVLPSA